MVCSMIEHQKNFSRHLGLSEYEWRVYVALVLEGVSEGRQLCIKSGVPRTKVYATLKKLMARGLVSELPGVPAKFVAVSPAEAFKEYLAALKKEVSEKMFSIDEAAKTLSFLEDAYQKKQLAVLPKKIDVRIVRGRAEMCIKIRDMLSKANKSVVVITTEKGFKLFYETYEKLLGKLVDKNVAVIVGVPVDLDKYCFMRELKYVCRIENVVSSQFFLLYTDVSQFLLGAVNADDFDANSGDDIGAFSENLDICGLIPLLLPKPVNEVFFSQGFGSGNAESH